MTVETGCEHYSVGKSRAIKTTPKVSGYVLIFHYMKIPVKAAASI